MKPPHDDALQCSLPTPEDESNYAAVAAQIKKMQVRALTVDQFEDVFVLIEWMQNALVKREQLAADKATKLDTREKAIASRERAFALRQRVTSLVGLVKRG